MEDKCQQGRKWISIEEEEVKKSKKSSPGIGGRSSVTPG
jgi:hypothetical protein